jgi:hypothetical protein
MDTYPLTYNRGSPISTDIRSLRELMRKSQAILLTASAVFPFDLFPDYIIIDENKVTVIHRDFVGIQHIHSVMIEDITNVDVEAGIFLAKLSITDSTNQRFPTSITISKLHRRDALHARRLIQGLIAAKRQFIDLSTIETKEAMREVDMVGKAQGLDTDSDY